MCSLFGVYDYKQGFNEKQWSKAVNTLAREAEVRGKDATGIAYNINGQMRIKKKALPAHKLKFYVPKGVQVVMGHTRFTTQGSEKFPQNNHPFEGRGFALAHNGVLSNDKELKKEYQLPDTDIETDSYVAVQLLEREKALHLRTIGNMAEKLRGTFTLTILDSNDNLYFVKGNNPLTIYDFYLDGFCMYASTSDILDRSVKKLKLKGRKYRKVHISQGEIGRISPTGQWDKMDFDFTAYDYSHWGYNFYANDCEYLFSDESDYFQELMNYGVSVGVKREELMLLAEYGFADDEIEELLFDPKTLHDIVDEMAVVY